MTKKEKALIIVAAVITFMLMVTYILIHNTKQQTTYIEYPKGTLSDSLFVSQNNTYTENKALPERYDFKRIPFSIDLPAGSTANVGDGYIVKIDENYMIYISEHDTNISAQTLFLSEFPAAVMMNYSPIYTYAQTQVSQTGYINGSTADYEFDMVSISDGAISKTVYTAIYDVKQLEKDEYASKITVAAITMKDDNESLASAKLLIDAIMATFRYNEKLDHQMKNEGSEYITADIEDIEEKKKPTSMNDLIYDSDKDASVKGVKIEEEYEDLFVIIYFENPSELAELSLFDTEYEEILERVVAADYRTTTFHVGKVTSDDFGRYFLKVTYTSDVGNITMKLEERGNEETAEVVDSEQENPDEGNEGEESNEN